MKDFSYKALGTGWHITIWDNIPDNDFEHIKNKIIEMTNEFDQTYSRFIETSLVSEISKSKGGYSVPSDFMSMLKMYMDLYYLTDKKLNPLIGFTISDLGYDSKYSLTPKENIRKTPDLFETVKIINENEIETTEQVLFDFGALGKGYMVDKITNYLKTFNLKRFLVNGSGDIYYFGEDKIQVGLEDPEDTSKVIGAIDMTTGAMCASGTNRRKWRDFHHVIDPDTSLSTTGIASTWVISDSTALSDALASCLFFVAPEKLTKFKFEYCIMNDERKIKNSSGFNAEFF